MPAPLPKFLIADDGGERDFVVHCHSPRLIIEFSGGRGEVAWIDDQQDFVQSEKQAGREPSITLARILREAGDFFLEQS